MPTVWRLPPSKVRKPQKLSVNLGIWKIPGKTADFRPKHVICTFSESFAYKGWFEFSFKYFYCFLWCVNFAETLRLKPLPHSYTMSSMKLKWHWYWCLIFGLLNLFWVIWVAGATVNVSGHFISFKEHKVSGLTLKTAYFSPKLEVTCKKLIRYRHFFWIFTITSILISYSWFVC